MRSLGSMGGLRGLALGMGGTSYDPDAAAVFARMTTPPSDTRKGLLNANLLAHKAGNVWPKTDVRWILAAADAQAARLNWKSASFTLTPVNAPAFTADRGYTGDGTSSYLTSGFDPTTSPAGLLMQTDSAHLGIWVRTAGATSGFDAGSQNNRGKVRGRPAASGASASLSTTSAVTWATAGTVPMSVFVVRRSSAEQLLFVNGALVATGANVSAGLISALDILRAAASYGDRQVCIVQAGAALSDAEVLAAHNADLTLLQAIGAV
jgi:hypothetical protein